MKRGLSSMIRASSLSVKSPAPGEDEAGTGIPLPCYLLHPVFQFRNFTLHFMSIVMEGAMTHIF